MISTKTREPLTAHTVYERLNGYDIFRRYIPEFKHIDKMFLSALYDDKKPSAKIYFSKDNGKWYYKDFGEANHVFAPIEYVMQRFGVGFNEALIMINNDFVLDLGSVFQRAAGICPDDILGARSLITPPERLATIKEEASKPTTLKIVSGDWSREHIKYWWKYGASRMFVKKYRIKALIGYFLNGKYFKIPKDEVAFAYCFGNYKYKIMRPNAPKEELKWITNCDSSIVQGDRQLPDKASKLYITKSLKDVIMLRRLGWAAVAPQSEGIFIPNDKLDDYRNRFDDIIIFYDNDEAGLKFAKKFSADHDLPYVYFPSDMEKDVSDNHYKMKNHSVLRQIVEELSRFTEADVTS